MRREKTMSNLINRIIAITALNEAQIEFDAHYWGLGEAKEIIDGLPTVNAVVIPEGATNGDMIEAMFDNKMAYNLEFYIKNYMLCTDWWNAPYKKGENK